MPACKDPLREIERRKKISIKFSGPNNPQFGKFGEDSPAYKDGHSQREDDLRQRCLERDNYTCQGWFPHKCKGIFHVHHIQSREDRPDLIYDIDNVTTICNSFHSIIEHKDKSRPEEVYDKVWNTIRERYTPEEIHERCHLSGLKAVETLRSHYTEEEIREMRKRNHE